MEILIISYFVAAAISSLTVVIAGLVDARNGKFSTAETLGGLFLSIIPVLNVITTIGFFEHCLIKTDIINKIDLKINNWMKR